MFSEEQRSFKEYFTKNVTFCGHLLILILVRTHMSLLQLWNTNREILNNILVTDLITMKLVSSFKTSKRMQKHHGSIIKVVYTSTIFLIFLSHIIVLCEKCAKMYTFLLLNKWFWVSYSIKRSQFDQNVNISWNHRKPTENKSKLKAERWQCEASYKTHCTSVI